MFTLTVYKITTHRVVCTHLKKWREREKLRMEQRGPPGYSVAASTQHTEKPKFTRVTICTTEHSWKFPSALASTHSNVLKTYRTFEYTNNECHADKIME